MCPKAVKRNVVLGFGNTSVEQVPDDSSSASENQNGELILAHCFAKFSRLKSNYLHMEA